MKKWVKPQKLRWLFLRRKWTCTTLPNKDFLLAIWAMCATVWFNRNGTRNSRLNSRAIGRQCPSFVCRPCPIRVLGCLWRFVKFFRFLLFAFRALPKEFCPVARTFAWVTKKFHWLRQWLNALWSSASSMVPAETLSVVSRLAQLMSHRIRRSNIKFVHY